MNLITLMNNIFLTSLFPSGLGKNTFFHAISMRSVFYSPHRCISFDLDTKDAPAVAVPKWGVWGEDYDTIRIDIDLFCFNFCATKGKNIYPSSFELNKIGKTSEDVDLYSLHIKEKKWSLSFSFEGRYVSFGGCKPLLCK